MLGDELKPGWICVDHMVSALRQLGHTSYQNKARGSMPRRTAKDTAIRRGPMARGAADVAANGRRHLDMPPSPASSRDSRALNSSLRFRPSLPSQRPPLLHSSSSFFFPGASSVGEKLAVRGGNGDGVVERAEELQRGGRAEAAGAAVGALIRDAAVRLRHHLRPRHHVRRVVPRPAPPRAPRRLLPRGLRVRPSGPRHRAGELRAVQGVGGVPLPLGYALRAWGAGAGGAGAGQLGEGAGVGGGAGGAGHLLRRAGAVGQLADHPGDRVPGHRLRGAPAHHGEGPREEEVPRRRLRPPRLLQGPRQVRGVQAQGDQERAAGDAGVRGVLRAAVGVPRHRPAGEPGQPPGGPVAQQHRRHHHPQNHLPLSLHAQLLTTKTTGGWICCLCALAGRFFTCKIDRLVDYVN